MEEDIEEQIDDMKIPRYSLPMNEESDEESSDEEDSIQQKYRAKYIKLKRQVKEFMFENAALQDEVAEVNEKINLFKEQRLLILQRLLQCDKELEQQYNQYQTRWLADNGTLVIPQKRKYRKRSQGDGSQPKIKGNKKIKVEKESVKAEVVDVKFTPAGQPICPFNVDGFTVHCLGEVIYNKNSYHTNEYIYPVGYSISRVYGHFKDPEKKCTYTCRVLDNGEYPRFEILASEVEPKFRISGPSPDYCHTTLLQHINSANAKNVDVRPQGERFFGLSNPTIMSFVAKLPNAGKCAKFVPPKKEGKPGTADASLNYETLQRQMNLSSYHNIPEIKEEPPEDLFDISDAGFKM